MRALKPATVRPNLFLCPCVDGVTRQQLHRGIGCVV
jgi:hypothetical protein